MGIGFPDVTRVWHIMIPVAFLVFLAACSGSTSGEATNAKDELARPEGNVTSSASPVSLANPCDAFSQNFSQTSDSPESDFARAVAQFAEDALEEVFDGDVSADCFFEFPLGGDVEVWISLTLPGAPPSGALQAVRNAMSARGAIVSSFYAAETVALDGLPSVKGPDGRRFSGGVMEFVGDQEGAYFAVMIASY